MDSTRLIVFTLLWTAIWAGSLPRLSRRAELIAGLVPFTAFGLRVFAGFFTGVADDDPVKATVAPLVEWVAGQTGAVPYQVVLDATVAIGLVWLASVFDIPKQSRLATAWLMPAAAMLSLASLRISGLPLEQLLATTLPALVLGVAFGGLIAAVILLTPSPIEVAIRRRAAVVVCITVPVAVIAVECLAPTPMSAATASNLSLAAGAATGLVARRLPEASQPPLFRHGRRCGGGRSCRCQGWLTNRTAKTAATTSDHSGLAGKNEKGCSGVRLADASPL